ncbi:ribosome maturation protein [Leucosporidium creatinivorum]|uniref:Ribosome maturation protein n=1 Tax=Leucosporidium creatinivorum TaxID=106004 RepID=A0A1Y2FN46_9BASI|nr:ribosome maturation protein [Leucosporidium creatinivorum]
MPSNTTTKAVYKPDSQSTDEFIVVVQDESAAQRWIGGDKTIPLVSIVDSFDVFHSGQGSQGILQRPSKQELETVFGTHNDTEIVETILTKGKFVTGKAIDSLGQSSKNTSGQQTSRGSVAGGR